MYEAVNRQLRGGVSTVAISGWGANSSELVFTITPTDGQPEALVMEFDATPQMFAAATTILVAAYHNGSRVGVTIPLNQRPGDTPHISGVNVPA